MLRGTGRGFQEPPRAKPKTQDLGLGAYLADWGLRGLAVGRACKPQY